MALSGRIALWRVTSPCGKKGSVVAFIARAFSGVGRSGLQNLPPLSDHLARDIGLSPADMEWSRHKLPSQHTHHPRG